MKLYFSPGACSLSPHIVLRELGLPFELVQVDLASKKLRDKRDFRTINPKGSVPVLELDDGETLTEGPAIVQYLADRKPALGLAPVNGSLARYHLQEWLNFISTELHKQFSPLFNPTSSEAVLQAQKERLVTQFTYIDQALTGRDYLLGKVFSVADAYLFTMLTWARAFQLDLAAMPRIGAYFERVSARPAVQVAQAAEREVKKT